MTRSPLDFHVTIAMKVYSCTPSGKFYVQLAYVILLSPHFSLPKVDTWWHMKTHMETLGQIVSIQ